MRPKEDNYDVITTLKVKIAFKFCIGINKMLLFKPSYEVYF